MKTIIAPKARPTVVITTLFMVAIILNIWMDYSSEKDEIRQEGGTRFEYQAKAVGSNGVVASENKLCSDIGVEILKLGGSAVDAAVATGICIGTTNMYSSGIGGGGFMLTYKDEKSLHFNFREMAPAGASPNMYVGHPEKAQIGGLAVGVPGELKGYYEAWKLMGVLSWKQLIEPSVKLAREGWIVNPWLARRILSCRDLILKDSKWSRTYAPNGRWLVAGDVIRRPIYANTLQEIAEQGPDVFYKGWMAKKIVDTVREAGGILTLQDMERYHVDISVNHV